MLANNTDKWSVGAFSVMYALVTIVEMLVFYRYVTVEQQKV